MARREPHATHNAGSVPNWNYRCFSVQACIKSSQIGDFRADSWEILPTVSAGGQVSAIGMEDLADHVARILTGQEQEGRSDLVGLARAAHRRVLAELGDLLGPLASERVEGGPDRTGRDSVDADALLDGVLRVGAGEGGHRALGRAVVEQLGRALVHRHRRAVDDRRALLEVRPGGLGHEEHAEHVGLEECGGRHQERRAGEGHRPLAELLFQAKTCGKAGPVKHDKPVLRCYINIIFSFISG